MRSQHEAGQLLLLSIRQGTLPWNPPYSLSEERMNPLEKAVDADAVLPLLRHCVNDSHYQMSEILQAGREGLLSHLHVCGRLPPRTTLVPRSTCSLAQRRHQGSSTRSWNAISCSTQSRPCPRTASVLANSGTVLGACTRTHPNEVTRLHLLGHSAVHECVVVVALVGRRAWHGGVVEAQMYLCRSTLLLLSNKGIPAVDHLLLRELLHSAKIHLAAGQQRQFQPQDAEQSTYMKESLSLFSSQTSTLIMSFSVGSK